MNEICKEKTSIHRHPLQAAVVFCLLPFMSAPAVAQDYTASTMWGTSNSGVAVNGAALSAQTHTQNGIIAGQVNAASRGLLVTTGSGSITVQAIGSQSIVTSTVNGSNNDVDLDSDLTSSNSGDVDNTGTVNAN